MAFLDDLVLHLRLDEASGATRVDAHGSNDFTVAGSGASATGKFGLAWRGNGDAPTPRLHCPHNAAIAFGTDQAFTWACWLKFEEGLESSGLIAGKKDEDLGNEWQLYADLYLGDEGYIYLDGPGFVDIEYPHDGEWHLVIAWYDPASELVCLQIDDGTPVEESHVDGLEPTDPPLLVGGAPNEPPLSGALDSGSFWKRVLSAPERAALWNSGDGLDYPLETGLLVSLVGHWQFDGDHLDAHGDNDLTGVGTVAATTGKLGDAWNGSKDEEFLHCPHNSEIAFATDQAFTFACWLKLTVFTAESPDSFGLIAGKLIAGEYDGEWLLGINISGDSVSLNALVWPAVGVAAQLEPAYPNDGEWHLVSLWHDPANDLIGLRIDDETPTQVACDGLGPQNLDLFIGGAGGLNAGTGVSTPGAIDSVWLWKRALSGTEITDLFDAGAGVDYPGPGGAVQNAELVIEASSALGALGSATRSVMLWAGGVSALAVVAMRARSVTLSPSGVSALAVVVALRRMAQAQAQAMGACVITATRARFVTLSPGGVSAVEVVVASRRMAQAQAQAVGTLAIAATRARSVTLSPSVASALAVVAALQRMAHAHALAVAAFAVAATRARSTLALPLGASSMVAASPSRRRMAHAQVQVVGACVIVATVLRGAAPAGVNGQSAASASGQRLRMVAALIGAQGQIEARAGTGGLAARVDSQALLSAVARVRRAIKSATSAAQASTLINAQRRRLVGALVVALSTGQTTALRRVASLIVTIAGQTAVNARAQADTASAGIAAVSGLDAVGGRLRRVAGAAHALGSSLVNASRTRGLAASLAPMALVMVQARAIRSGQAVVSGASQVAAKISSGAVVLSVDAVSSTSVTVSVRRAVRARVEGHGTMWITVVEEVKIPMPMSSDEVDMVAIEQTTLTLWAEWLKDLFDGGLHQIGVRIVRLPVARLSFQQAFFPDGLNGAGIHLVWTSPGRQTVRWEVNGSETRRRFSTRATWSFFVRARLDGQPQPQAVALASDAASKLYFVLRAPEATHHLAEKGIGHLRPELPVLITDAPGGYAVRSVGCSGTLTYWL